MTSLIASYCEQMDNTSIQVFFEGRSALNVNYRYYPASNLAVVESFDPWIIPDLQKAGYDVVCLDRDESYPREENTEEIIEEDHFSLIPTDALRAISHIDIIKCNGRSKIVSSKKVIIGNTEYTFPEPTFVVPVKEKVKKEKVKKSDLFPRDVMKDRIQFLFGSGEFTRECDYDTYLYIRPCKDYITEYRLHFPIRNVKEFKEILTEVLVSCGHDILANKKGDYECRRPSLYFGLYMM